MNQEHWQKVKGLFDAAVELAPQKRKRFLDKSCGKDDGLRCEVENLLDSFENAKSFMEQPAAREVAGLIIGKEERLINGQIIAHYEIINLLGAGGMGEVYLAEDMKLHRRVALKVIHKNLSADNQANERLLREAQAAATLDHPHICAIHEISEAENCSFIVMQFVEGETLAEKLRKEKLSVQTSLNLAIQIADALEEAHAHHIIHRDIKPANIIINNKGQAKVLDFGLAKFVKAESEGETAKMLSTPGTIMGTVPYMSPEQLRGKTLDGRSDIFSFGAMFYEMLGGRQPFSKENNAETISTILNDEPSFVEIPAHLQSIVQKSLAKNKTERYQTARDLVVDLKNLQKRLEFEAGFLRERETGKQGEGADVMKIQPFPFLPVSSSPLLELSPFLNSIAILPFANMSADAENEYFCDGLAEELLNALAKIDDLKVAARTSAFSFKGKNTNISEIGNILNVKTVLEGSVRKSGNQLRITVQLINSSDGYHLWSERYDREMKDIFDVQDEITLAVVNALKVKLLGEEKAAVLKRYTDNPQAYEFYLKGIYYRWKLTPDEFGKCREYFQQAVDADPSFALGYFGLASYYGYGTAWGLLSIPPDEGWQKAEAAMAKVIELDAALPEVLISHAFKLVHYREWDEAGKGIEQAVKLNPNFPEIRHLYSFYLLAVGRFNEAIAEGRRAFELDPLSLNYSRFLGICFYFARRYDEAIEQFNQALELDPNNASVHESLGEVFARKEMFGEAIAAWQRALTLEKDDELAAILKNADTETDCAAAVHAVAQKKIERMHRAIENGGFVLAIGFARAYVMLGDTEQAFEWLEKACEERNVFPLLINSDPFYDNVREDSRFQDLLRRIGLPTDES